MDPNTHQQVKAWQWPGQHLKVRRLVQHIILACSMFTVSMTSTADDRGPGSARLTTLFGNNAPPPAFSISGTVFEDVNYGGGAGRNLATALGAGGSARPGARVELYNSAGNYVAFTTTNASGVYSFTGLATGTYTVRVVNSSVSSARPGYTSGTHLAVQTYLTNASTGSALPVTDRVGGEAPELQDAGNGSTTLAALTTATTTAQSVALVNSSVNVSGVDFGFNFNLVVSTRDAGQGSLRRFIINANGLGGEAALAQSGVRKMITGSNEPLPAGKESSIFMIPNGVAVPGLRAGLANQLSANGVASITVASALPAITGANTNIDGTTQTCNVGNTNAVTLGAGGTVGVDALPLQLTPGPEVEVRDIGTITNGLDVQANGTAIRGLCVVGFGDADGQGGVRIANNFTGTMVELNVLGTRAHALADPGAGYRNWAGLDSDGGDAGYIQYNVIAYSTRYGTTFGNGSTNWTVQYNEIRNCGNDYADGDGITINASASNLMRANLITGTSSQGIVITGAAAATLNTIVNNTLTGNGVGIPSSIVQSPGICMRSGVLKNKILLNVISANYGAGVMLNNGSNGTFITRNSIFANGTINARTGAGPTNQIGIDLNASGDDANFGSSPFVTTNDAGDGDAGANNLQNYPVITSATSGGGNTTIVGSLNTLVSSNFRVEFFSSPSADPSGFGEGQRYLGFQNVNTNGAGNAAINTTLAGVSVAIGHVVSATASFISPTDTVTSEFSGTRMINIAPVAICQNISMNLNGAGTASITAAMINNGSYDPDGSIASLSVSPSAFNCSNVGPNTVTLTVTDNLGATATCTATVTVVDNLVPSITCPANITVSNAVGTCGAVVNYTAPVGTDNCPGATTARIAGLASGSTFPVGINTVTYRVTDASGNTAQCSFTITVNDTQNPSITCPANITTNVDPGSCNAVVNYTAPVGVDNCPGSTTIRIAGPASGSTFPPGTTTITYQVTDASGNTASCSFTITINPGNDNDGDGVCDNVDLDDDNDGILDTSEIGDTDGDGVPDSWDLDSDNDGIYDVVEAGSGQPFTNGVLNGAVTANGIPISVDGNADDILDYTVADSDSDGTIDAQEPDSDNDGCYDVIEAGYTDANGDGELGDVPLTVNANGLVTSGGP